MFVGHPFVLRCYIRPVWTADYFPTAYGPGETLRSTSGRHAAINNNLTESAEYLKSKLAYFGLIPCCTAVSGIIYTFRYTLKRNNMLILQQVLVPLLFYRAVFVC
jgi:hypothetical protein